MSKTAVIFEGKYGTTKQYARWISEELNGTLFDTDSCKKADFADFDTIIFGGAIHAGGILGMDKFRKLYPKIADKKVYTFAVGLSVFDKDACDECRQLNFNKRESSFKMLFRKGTGTEGKKTPLEENFSRLPCAFFPGAYDPGRISGGDKTLMAVVKKMIEKKSPSQRTDSEKELLKAITDGADYVDRAAADAFVKAVKAEK